MKRLSPIVLAAVATAALLTAGCASDRVLGADSGAPTTVTTPTSPTNPSASSAPSTGATASTGVSTPGATPTLTPIPVPTQTLDPSGDAPTDLIQGSRRLSGVVLPRMDGCRLLRTDDGRTALLLGDVTVPDAGSSVRVLGTRAVIRPKCPVDFAVTVTSVTVLPR